MAGEKPVGRPLADPGQRGQCCFDLVVGQKRERIQVEVAAREAGRVLGLTMGEAERMELVRLGRGQPLARRERVGVVGADAEALDQTVANRERGVERDLLRGDRRDEALEGLDGDRRPQPAEVARETRQDRLSCGERVERVEVELGAEQPPHDRRDLGIERLHVDSAGRLGDPDLPSVDDPVQAPFVPEVGEVGAEGAIAGCRKLEGVGLRELEERHSYAASASDSAWKSVNGSNGFPWSAR